MNANFRRIEHRDTEDVAVARGPGAYDFGEKDDTDAHELAGLAAFEGLLPLRLLGAQLLVADGLHRLLQRGLIVAGVVDPTKSWGVGKLLAADEVFHAEVGGIHTELLRHDIHGAFDRIRGFGDAERAAIGNTAWRLVGIDAVDRHMRGWDVVRATDDAEQPRRPFRGIGAGVEGAVVGNGVAA